MAGDSGQGGEGRVAVVTGGASGSPILDEDGRVVAVLSAGNIEVNPLGSRAPSALGRANSSPSSTARSSTTGRPP